MTACALCPRPAAQHWGMCQPCHERDLIRGARLRWEGAAIRRREARQALSEVAHAAVDVALSTESDRGEWLRLHERVEGLASTARRHVEEAIRLHNEAGARALELWQLRGRTGVLALRVEDMPAEDPTP